MLLALGAMTATLPAGDERLVVGSKWYCLAVGPSEHYTAELAVEPGRSTNEKNLHVLSTTGDIALSGYGVGLAKADHCEKNGSDLIVEFGQGFNNFGLSLFTQWDRADEGIFVTVHTLEPTAPASEKRNEPVYGLSCCSLEQPLRQERT